MNNILITLSDILVVLLIFSPFLLPLGFKKEKEIKKETIREEIKDEVVNYIPQALEIIEQHRDNKEIALTVDEYNTIELAIKQRLVGDAFNEAMSGLNEAMNPGAITMGKSSNLIYVRLYLAY